VALGDSLANDLFGSAESVDWSRIDNVDTMLDRGSDRRNGFRFIGPTPHPSANSPGADRNTRGFKPSVGNVDKFHIGFDDFGLTLHCFRSFCECSRLGGN
jgi:hypothetical protein